MPKPQHLFFDLDGTLNDSSPGIVRSLRHALVELGVEPPTDAALTAYIGDPLKGVFEQVLGPERAELVPRALLLYRERFSKIGLFENSVYPGVVEGLDELQKSGRTLWLVTGKPTVFAEQILEHFALRRFFTKVYGSELSGVRADKAELIAYVLEQEKISPDDAVMIGDRAHDTGGGTRHGLRAEGVLWGYGTREELMLSGARAVHATMAELVRALLASS